MRSAGSLCNGSGKLTDFIAIELFTGINLTNGRIHLQGEHKVRPYVFYNNFTGFNLEIRAVRIYCYFFADP